MVPARGGAPEHAPVPAALSSRVDLPSIIGERTLHTGRKFDYVELSVRNPSSGLTHSRQMVRHPGAVVILPMLPDGRVVLIRNYRVTARQWLIELPAGTLDAGEAPEACARRELLEETGYRAGSVRTLGAFRTSPGMSDELMHAVCATGLVHEQQHLEEDEHIEVMPVTPAQAMAMVDQGHIADGKTLATLLLGVRHAVLRLEAT
jgi:ADP-ribose pyrophosphatase